MKFAQLLHDYRKASKLSQDNLAEEVRKKLKKESGFKRQYLGMIEREKEPPPKFDICMAMTEIFKLSPAQKYAFIESAFKERIRLNIEYYQYLNQNKHSARPEYPASDIRIKSKQERALVSG